MKENHHKRLTNYTINGSSEPRQYPPQLDVTRTEAFTSPWRPKDIFALSVEQKRRETLHNLRVGLIRLREEKK